MIGYSNSVQRYMRQFTGIQQVLFIPNDVCLQKAKRLVTINLQQEHLALVEQLKKLHQYYGKSQEKIEEQQIKIKDLEKQVELVAEAHKNSLDNSMSQRSQRSDRKRDQDLYDRIFRLEQDLSCAQNQNGSLLDDIKNIGLQRDQFQQQLQTKSQELLDLNKTHNGLLKELRQYNRIKEDNSQSKKFIEMQRENQELSREFSRIQRENLELNNKLSTIEAENQQLRNKSREFNLSQRSAIQQRYQPQQRKSTNELALSKQICTLNDIIKATSADSAQQQQQMLQSLSKECQKNQELKEQLQSALKDKTHTELGLEFAVKESSKLSLALDHHIHARSQLTKTIYGMLVNFTYLAEGRSLQVRQFNQQGLFVGSFLPEHSMYSGILFRHTDAPEHVSLGYWDVNFQQQGYGVRLHESDIVFCGSYKDGLYDGQSLYIRQDGSVQSGEMQRGFFNGHSIKVSREGKIWEGNWKRDKLVDKSFQD